MSKRDDAKAPESPPPIFHSWRRFYVIVLANTFLVYVLLLLFSAYAR